MQAKRVVLQIFSLSRDPPGARDAAHVPVRLLTLRGLWSGSRTPLKSVTTSREETGGNSNNNNRNVGAQHVCRGIRETVSQTIRPSHTACLRCVVMFFSFFGLPSLSKGSDIRLKERRTSDQQRARGKTDQTDKKCYNPGSALVLAVSTTFASCSYRYAARAGACFVPYLSSTFIYEKNLGAFRMLAKWRQV